MPFRCFVEWSEWIGHFCHVNRQVNNCSNTKILVFRLLQRIGKSYLKRFVSRMEQMWYLNTLLRSIELLQTWWHFHAFSEPEKNNRDNTCHLFRACTLAWPWIQRSFEVLDAFNGSSMAVFNSKCHYRWIMACIAHLCLLKIV